MEDNLNVYTDVQRTSEANGWNIKKSIAKLVERVAAGWESKVGQEIYRYRHRILNSGKSPSKLLDGVRPRLIGADELLGKEISEEERMLENVTVVIARSNRALSVPESSTVGTKVHFGKWETVLVAHGKRFQELQMADIQLCLLRTLYVYRSKLPLLCSSISK